MAAKGVIVPVATPCTRDGEPDLQALAQLCKTLITCGNHGLFVSGSTGRGPFFSREWRLQICQTAADAANGNVPVFAGALANSPQETLDLIPQFADHGANYVVCTPPGYYPYSSDETEALLLGIADHASLPILLYDIPVLAGNKLLAESVQRFAGHKNIIGLKDSSADMPRFREIATLLQDQSGFGLLQGKEPHICESYALGATGIVTSFSNFAPLTFIALHRALIAGHSEIASRLQEHVDRIYDVVVQAYAQRSPISTLFFLIDHVMRAGEICNNLILPHEKTMPAALAGFADSLLQETLAAEALAEQTMTLSS